MNKQDSSIITILTSFYNVETYIQNCITMLKAQSTPNFNVILVDDGSTDRSYQKCIELIGSDKRFSVIKHEYNKGLGSGRITGIKNTHTKYLTYIDPDDYLAPNAVENYIQDIKKTNAEYIVYDYIISNENGKEELITDYCKTTEELFITKSRLISHVWHKVVKTDLYKRFDYSFLSKVSFAEDLFNSINCFLYSKHTKIIHKAYYTYKYNSYSLVHNRTEKSIKENIEVNKVLLKTPLLEENFHIKKYIEEDSFHAFGQLIFPNKANEFQKKAHFSDWRVLDKDCNISIPKNTSSFVRIYIWLIRHKAIFLANIFYAILFIKQNSK